MFLVALSGWFLPGGGYLVLKETSLRTDNICDDSRYFCGRSLYWLDRCG